MDEQVLSVQLDPARMEENFDPVPEVIVIAVSYTHLEDIDWTKWTFSGYVDIELNVKEETDFVMLNAKELAIHVRYVS